MNRLEIEWRHLVKNGKTCERFSDTGETVRVAYADLVKELEAKGWKVILKETLLTDQKTPESNSIYCKGIAREAAARYTEIGELLRLVRRESRRAHHVPDLFEQNGHTFEAVPAATVLEAAHRFIETQTK